MPRQHLQSIKSIIGWYMRTYSYRQRKCTSGTPNWLGKTDKENKKGIELFAFCRACNLLGDTFAIRLNLPSINYCSLGTPPSRARLPIPRDPKKINASRAWNQIRAWRSGGNIELRAGGSLWTNRQFITQAQQDDRPSSTDKTRALHTKWLLL